MTAIPGDVAVLCLLVMAAGLHLPLLLLVPFLLSVAPWTPDLSGGLSLLASPGPAGLGVVLLCGSAVLERVRGLGWAWRGVIALGSLPAAALLPFLILDPSRPAAHFAAAAALSVFVAVVLQGVVQGQALLRGWGTPWRSIPSAPLHRMGVGACVVLLVTGAALAPAQVVIPAGLALAAGVWWYFPALRAAVFVPLLVAGWLRRLAGRTGWREHSALPAWLPRSEGDGSGIGGIPAGLVGHSRADGFRSGWLVADSGTPRFLYRTPSRVWEIEVGTPPGDASGAPSWGHRLPLEFEEGLRVLLVPADGPPPFESPTPGSGAARNPAKSGDGGDG